MRTRKIAPASIIINPLSAQSVGHKIFAMTGNALGTLIGNALIPYPVANKAIFVPFCIRTRMAVAHLYTDNGASVAGNVDVGLYDLAGNLLRNTGSKAQSGTSAAQISDVTTTEIGPGIYLMAIAADGVTGQYSAQSGTPYAGMLGCCGVMEQTSAFPLPGKATLSPLTSNYLPMFGIIGTTPVM